jgi:Ca2+-binding EF-hand superfamily protein
MDAVKNRMGGEIDFHQFEKQFKERLSSQEDPHGHHKAFIRLDTNGDLTLSKEEMGGLKKLMARVRCDIGRPLCTLQNLRISTFP